MIGPVVTKLGGIWKARSKPGNALERTIRLGIVYITSIIPASANMGNMNSVIKRIGPGQRHKIPQRVHMLDLMGTMWFVTIYHVLTQMAEVMIEVSCISSAALTKG